VRKLLVVALAAFATSTAVVSTASAEPPRNYGACVSTGAVDPSEDRWGPSNFMAFSASDEHGGTFWTAITNSDGHVPFNAPAWCFR